MALVKKLSARLQNHPKRIVYPEGNDPRIIQAARQFATRKLGVPILIGEKSKIEEQAKSLDVRLDGIKIIDPVTADDSVALMKLLCGMPKFKDFDPQEINALALQPNYFATLMMATGRADAMVAGATVATSSVLRPVLQIIPLQKNFSTASSMMIVSTENPEIGVDGDLFLADCGVIPEPTEEQLCDIAITTAILVNHLTLETPRRGDAQPYLKIAGFKNAQRFEDKIGDLPRTRKGENLRHYDRHRRRTSSRRCAPKGSRGVEGHKQLGCGTRQCFDFPRPQFGQHRLKNASGHIDGKLLRTNSHRTCQADSRNFQRRDSQRNIRHERSGRRAGGRQAFPHDGINLNFLLWFARPVCPFKEGGTRFYKYFLSPTFPDD